MGEPPAEALAVDDFSSWYVTLGVIQALPVDVVKLCQRYVRGMGTLEGERIVATVVTQAHANGLTVVAEGAETSRCLRPSVVPSDAVGGTSPARLDLTGRLPGPRAASDRLVDR